MLGDVSIGNDWTPYKQYWILTDYTLCDKPHETVRTMIVLFKLNARECIKKQHSISTKLVHTEYIPIQLKNIEFID